LRKERTTNTSKTKVGSHTELRQVVELNKEGGKKTQRKTQNTISGGAPQMDRISSSLSMMYTALQSHSSSLEQEHTQRLKTSSSFFPL